MGWRRNLILELLLPRNKPIIVGTVHRPPKHSSFLDSFENALTRLRTDCETIILGYFNICVLHKSGSFYSLITLFYGFLI
jgi:hypothetical protein